MKNCLHKPDEKENIVHKKINVIVNETYINTSTKAGPD